MNRSRDIKMALSSREGMDILNIPGGFLAGGRSQTTCPKLLGHLTVVQQT